MPHKTEVAVLPARLYASTGSQTVSPRYRAHLMACCLALRYQYSGLGSGATYHFFEAGIPSAQSQLLTRLTHIGSAHPV